MTTTTGIDSRLQAARDALHTHDRLRRVQAAGDQFRLGPDGQPLDAAAWLAWREQQYRPALAAWQQAMQPLALTLGAEFPGRHPHEWRLVCELILTRADAAAQTATRTDRDTDDTSDGEGLDADRRDRRAVLLARIGGENKAVRAEQARARGVPDRMIARPIGVGLATVRAWFHLQDQLLLDDDDSDDDEFLEPTTDAAGADRDREGGDAGFGSGFDQDDRNDYGDDLVADVERVAVGGGVR
jgi:hypothetical protein